LVSVFERCARASLLRSQDDLFEISSAPAASAAGGSLLIITTSSFAFRLLTIFHVDDNEANRGYFVPAGSGLSLQDSFAEVANLCCGALNREIARVHAPKWRWQHPGVEYMLFWAIICLCAGFLPQIAR